MRLKTTFSKRTGSKLLGFIQQFIFVYLLSAKYLIMVTYYLTEISIYFRTLPARFCPSCHRSWSLIYTINNSVKIYSAILRHFAQWINKNKLRYKYPWSLLDLEFRQQNARADVHRLLYILNVPRMYVHFVHQSRKCTIRVTSVLDLETFLWKTLLKIKST